MNSASFTGHRPSKLNGYNPKDNKELLWKLRGLIVDHIENKGVKIFITGMALGIDTWAALIVLKLKETYPDIQLIAAIPCANHPNKWNTESRNEWQSIVDRCDKVIYVSKEEYTPYCMMDRNKFMVNSSEYIIAVWDGSKGGTGNCVTYAQKKIKQENITILKP